MTSERTRRFLAVLASLERERGFKPIRSSNEAGLMTFPREERPSGLGSLLRSIVDIVKRVQDSSQMAEGRGQIRIS